MEFCTQSATFTLNDGNLGKEVVSPGYPDSYFTIRLCVIAITVDVSQPFSVTLVSHVENCSTAQYLTALETPTTPLEKTSTTCSSFTDGNQLTTRFKYTGNEDDVEIGKIHVYLLQGPGNGFSLLISGNRIYYSEADLEGCEWCKCTTKF